MNMFAQYEIVGRVPCGTSIEAYMLADKYTGNITKIDKDLVNQLALNKQIVNCTAQIYGDGINLRGINCKLSELPIYDALGNKEVKHSINIESNKDLILIGKVTKGRIITDYVIAYVDKPNLKIRFPKEIVIQMVKAGRIKNVTYQNNKGHIVLRGINGTNLSKLENYSF